MQDNTKVAVTFRNNSNETALPIRRWESFLPGQGLGGSFVHWNGQSFRAQVADFIYKTHHEQRYGKNFVEQCDPNLTIQDWGVTYEELEPYYDRFEYLCGVGGKAGNIKGQIQRGGNPFEAPRSREYPNPPLKETYFGAIFRKGAENLGYHPYPQPSSNPPGHTQMGSRLEAGGGSTLQPHDTDPAARYVAVKSAQLSRPRSRLQRRLGSAASAHDLRLSRE